MTRSGHRPPEGGVSPSPPSFGAGMAAVFRQMPQLGAELAGYRLLESLGRGGQGEVWKAEPRGGGAPVALKLLHQLRHQQQGREESHKRMLEVIARAREVVHPNLVRILDFGRLDDMLWVAQEFVSGGRDLSKEIADQAAGRNLEPGRFQRAARWMEQVAAGVSALHQAGIQHGDLKPANVLIDPAGQAKVADLGLARVLQAGGGSLLDGQTFAGTALYAAPEALLERPDQRDVRCDVYSLGVMLYELCALTRPMRSLRLGQVAQGALERTPAPPEAPDRVPEPLARIAMRCLEPNPRWRYRSALELSSELKRYLRGEDPQTPPVTLFTRLYRWARELPGRPREARVLGAASLLVGLAGWQVLEREWRRERGQVREELLALCQAAADSSGLAAVPLQRGRLEATLALARESLAQEPHPLLQEALSAPLLQTEGRRPVWGLERRLAACLEAERWYREKGGEERWNEVRLALARDGRFAGQVPLAEPDLFPLGKDERSGLFEFWLVQSGSMPLRAPDGQLECRPEDGLVLVLLPPGRYSRGLSAWFRDEDLPWQELAQMDWRERARLDDADATPQREIAVDAFYLSKWELTQAQYQRLCGLEPSAYAAGDEIAEHGGAPGQTITASHPVESVSALDAEFHLALWGLELPSESRHEYAARAGAMTRYPCGEELECLLAQPIFNCMDLSLVRVEPSLSPAGFDPSFTYDDGFARHGPVDRVGVNPFGLVGIHGNVWEWCADTYDPQAHALPMDQEAWRGGPDPRRRSLRGGGWRSPFRQLACYDRWVRSEQLGEADIGVRPMRRPRAY